MDVANRVYSEDLTLWDTRSGKPAWTLPERVVRTTFSADSKTLVGRGADINKLKAWDVETGAERWEVELDGRVGDLISVPNQESLFSIGGGRIFRIALHDGSTEQTTQFDINGANVGVVAMSSIGEKLAIVSHMANEIFLINSESGEVDAYVASKEKEALHFRNAAFSEDLALMAVVGREIGPVVVDVEKMLAGSDVEL